MKILITGSNGQLGREFRKYAPEHPEFEFLFTDIDELDITDKVAVDQYFGVHRPEAVINCAAYTAVDKAEVEIDRAFLINGEAPGILALAASLNKALFIHISTDYIFNGERNTPYTEDDPADPRSVYARSKYQGEIETIALAARGIILRTSWLYSEFNANFVKTILKRGEQLGELNVVFDQTGCPTYARDLATTILQMIPALDQHHGVEIYHYSNEGVATWYDFAKAIVEFSGISCRIKPILTAEYPLPAARPVYSVMSKAKIRKRFMITPPYWRDSLKDCIVRIMEQER